MAPDRAGHTHPALRQLFEHDGHGERVGAEASELRIDVEAEEAHGLHLVDDRERLLPRMLQLAL